MPFMLGISTKIECSEMMVHYIDLLILGNSKFLLSFCRFVSPRTWYRSWKFFRVLKLIDRGLAPA